MSAALREAGKVGLGLVIAAGAILCFGAVNRIVGDQDQQADPQSRCRDNVRFHAALEDQLKDSLRDPSSFELIGYGGGMIDADGIQPILMRFRARNGFGGMNVETARATVRVDSCRIVDWKLLD